MPKQCEVVCRKDILEERGVDIQEVIREHKTIKKWAYILHDKDDTAPHYHIYLNFGNNNATFEVVANWFKVDANFVEKVKGRRTDMLIYLTHGQPDQKHKYQYLSTEITANFDFESEIAISKIIGDFENHSYAQQLAYVDSLATDVKPKVFKKLNELWKIYCQCLMLKPDRNIDVMFITGDPGAGKTTYAKKLCEQLKYDYCISSSSNDPCQDYMGQNALILDDLRDTTFKHFEDLLKFLDNNTASSVRSRFANKVFNGKLIIITSTVPLHMWYIELLRTKDNRQQLFRRIGTYVNVKKDYVMVYNKIDELGYPKDVPLTFKNELEKLVVSTKDKTDYGKVFGGMLQDASDEIIERFYNTRR